MKEIWKDVKGFEKYYKVSNFGRVISKPRKIIRPNGVCVIKPEKEMKLPVDNGYARINFSINGKNHLKRVHRLVAEAFIPNPQNKPCINHIDGNKQNNHISNLEWCTKKENIIHSCSVLGNNKHKVYCVELDRVFESTSEAAKFVGLSISAVSRVAKKTLTRGKYYNKTAGGYQWKPVC